jgi:ElaB/YqjD/DUF883 family membrane-anchored ribosome-binding protein
MEATRRISDAAAGLGAAVDRAAAGAHDKVDRAASAANVAAKAVEEKTDRLRDVQQHYLDACRNSVREKPLLAIGLAVTAGCLLSFLFGRR